MNGTEVKHPLAGGIQTLQPQDPSNASIAQNLTREESGWSTRLGYEKFDPDLSNGMGAFASVGAVYSIYVHQALAGGARQEILFEADGTLYYAYDAAGAVLLRTIASDRHIPTITEPASTYTSTPHGVLVTNGVDQPLLVSLWPLGTSSESSTTIQNCKRSYGSVTPSPVHIHTHKPMSTAASPTDAGAGATALWCTSNPNSIPDEGQWGVGFGGNAGTSPGNISLFEWAVSFITSTGSEGPLSPVTRLTWDMPGSSAGFRAAVVLNIPIGPDGTVARKIYRTKNFSPDTISGTPGDKTLYYLDTVRENVSDIYVDAHRSPSGIVAPLTYGQVPAQARVAAFWDGRVWADGGPNESTTLVYSASGLIETFPLENYFRLSSSITKIHPSYGSLLIFRERGIDIVQKTGDGSYYVSTLTDDVGTISPHTVKTVPSVGVCFLGHDAQVYAVTGGVQGGAVADVVPLTKNLPTSMRKVSKTALPKAVAVYSHQWEEFHIYMATNGRKRPSLGLVLHVGMLTQAPSLSPWSTRSGFPVGCIDTLYDGTLIFGHHTGNPSQSATQAGLFIISHRRQMGEKSVADVWVQKDPPTSKYKCAWNDFGDLSIKKQILYSTLWVMTTGSAEIDIRWYKDFEDTYTYEKTYICQPPDRPLLPVLDTAIVGTAAYSSMKLVPIRIAIANYSCSTYAWEVSTTDDIIILGWEDEITSKNIKVIAGKR